MSKNKCSLTRSMTKRNKTNHKTDDYSYKSSAKNKKISLRCYEFLNQAYPKFLMN